MKSCPKCNRTFPDEGQKFCTFDGGLLIAPQSFDPNATIRATAVDLVAPTDKATSRELPDPNATIVEQFPATIALPRHTGPTSTPNTADLVPPAPPQPPPPPPPPVHTTQPEPTQPPPAPVAPATVAPPPAAKPAKKGSKMPLIIAAVLIVLLLGGGGLAAAFFLVIKPKLDQRNAQLHPEPTATPTPIAQVSPSPVPSPTEQAFVPPADAIEFTNSNANLDGRLAEHYLDFSFYYPKGWVKDPKSGVKGATNFILVERALPTKETQENVAVSWYTSSGTFVGDTPNFPKRVEEVSASLSKQFDGYEKVSDGPTKVNSLDAYEFRWKASAELPTRGPVELWGRVIFVPTGKEGDTTGVTLLMFSTSLAPELGTVEDLGKKGQAPLILDSFRFGKK